MSDNFIRNVDNSVIWRLDDEIKLSITRLWSDFDHTDSGTACKKAGDPAFIRRQDDAPIDHPSDDPAFVREDDDPGAERDEDNDPMELR